MIKNRMNLHVLTRLAFLFVLQIGVSICTSAQSNNVPVTPAMFQQLDFEHQRILVHDWMNQSRDVIILASFEEKAIQFYTEQGQSLSIYSKMKSVFQPMFNDAIHISTRISYCNFLLLNFGEDEIPLQLIRTQQQLLIKQSTK